MFLRSINSIKGELIPYLIKKQYRGRRKLGEAESGRQLGEAESGRQLGEGGSNQDDTKNGKFPNVSNVFTVYPWKWDCSLFH